MLPGSTTIEPRTLTDDEQERLVLYLKQQRIVIDELRATSLTPQQQKLLGRLFHLRLCIYGLLEFGEAILCSAATSDQV